MRRFAVLSLAVLTVTGSAFAQFGDLRAWVYYKHTGPKPANWVKPVRERFWGQDNFLLFERKDGRNSIQLNAREVDSPAVADLLNPDGTLRREAPPGYAYVGYCEWDESAALPDAAHFERMKFNNPGLKVRMGSGLISYPLVLDFDGDGVRDVLLSCECRRWYRTDFFRNLGKRGDVFPTFAAGVRVGTSGGNTVLTHRIDGDAIVTTRSEMYSGFPTNVYRVGRPINLPDFSRERINEKTWRLCDYNGDGRQDYLVSADIWTRAWDDAYDAKGVWTGGVNRCHTWIYTNRADSATAYARPFAVTGPDGKPLGTGTMTMLEDFDGDGDLDILAKGPRNGFNYCENIGTRTAPRYAAPKVVCDEKGNEVRMDSPITTPSAYDWNEDGRMDIVSGDESGGCAFIENTGKLKNGIPVFRPPRYFLQQADGLKVEVLPSIAAVDFDGDGDQDFLVGTAAGFVEFIENLSGPGVERPRWAAPRRLSARPLPGSPVPSNMSLDPICIRAGENGSIQSPGEKMWGYLCISAGDWDGDGLVDLMCGDIRGEIHWFRNVGTRTKPRLAGPIDVEAEWPGGVQPELAWGWMKPSKMKNPRAILTQWRCTPAMVDWNRDGLMDLLLVDTEGYLCVWYRERRADGTRVLRPPVRALVNADNGRPLRLNSEGKGKSGRRRIAVADWDGDGKLDIFVSAESAFWWRQEGEKDGTWRFRNRGEVATDKLQWHESSPAIVDFNADGIPDIVVTGEDGFFNYFRNPRTMRADAEKSWQEPKTATKKNLLVNPSFEQFSTDGKPTGWSFKAYKGTNPFVAAHGHGINGSGGVKCENRDPNTVAAIKQRVKVEPGHIYSFECRIRPDNLVCKGEGVVSTIEWHDAKGNRLGGTVVPNSGIRGTQKQFLVSRPRQTPRMPDNVASAELTILLNAGATGACYIDDACFWESTPAPVDALTSDVYRDVADAGEVTFVAGLDLESSAIDPKDVRGIYSVLSADGKTRQRFEATRIETYRACVTVPVKELAMGSQLVAFALKDRRTGKLLGTSSMTFTRVAKLPPRKVGFDRFGRTLVDGKPFFPFGMLAGEMNPSNVTRYAESVFNCVMPYRMPTKAVMDDCWAHGIRVAYDLRNGVLGWADTDRSVKTPADEIFWMRQKVIEFGQHPALLAWYTNDEFDLADLKHLTILHRVLVALDPDHPAITCIYQVPNTRGYLPSFDVIGTDPYPIDEAPISLVTDWTRKTRRGVMGARPLWQVPQAFDWAYYRKQRGGSLEGLRFPTREEMENMAWQAIAAGANGLMFYAFHDVFRDDPAKADERWEDVKAMARAVKAHESTLLAADGPIPEIAGETETIVARAYNAHGRIKLLVVNADRKAQTAKLTVAGKGVVLELKPLESRWVE